jgi:purine-cytosine permease-like protein
MSKVFAGVAGLVALSAGIFGGVDAVLSLQRAVVAFVAGGVLGAIVQAFVGAPVKKNKKPDEAEAQDSEKNQNEAEAERAA